MRRGVVASLLLGMLALSVRADDWPQWRGPDRSGVSKEKGLLKSWPAAGPTQVWMSEEAGTGFGSPAIVGDLVYVLGADRQDGICHRARSENR